VNTHDLLSQVLRTSYEDNHYWSDDDQPLDYEAMTAFVSQHVKDLEELVVDFIGNRLA
tara:strand:- start:23 stop:196 length:174 start_codon:yes stop_codon:yes gene_type:complete